MSNPASFHFTMAPRMSLRKAGLQLEVTDPARQRSSPALAELPGSRTSALLPRKTDVVGLRPCRPSCSQTHNLRLDHFVPHVQPECLSKLVILWGRFHDQAGHCRQEELPGARLWHSHGMFRRQFGPIRYLHWFISMSFLYPFPLLLVFHHLSFQIFRSLLECHRIAWLLKRLLMRRDPRLRHASLRPCGLRREMRSWPCPLWTRANLAMDTVWETRFRYAMPMSECLLLLRTRVPYSCNASTSSLSSPPPSPAPLSAHGTPGAPREIQGSPPRTKGA